MNYLYQNSYLKMLNTLCLFFLLLYVSTVAVAARITVHQLNEFVKDHTAKSISGFTREFLLLLPDLTELTFYMYSEKILRLDEVLKEDSLGSLWEHSSACVETSKESVIIGFQAKMYISMVDNLFKKYKIFSGSDVYVLKKYCIPMRVALQEILSFGCMEALTKSILSKQCSLGKQKNPSVIDDYAQVFATEKQVVVEAETKTNINKLTDIIYFDNGNYSLQFIVKSKNDTMLPRKTMKLLPYYGNAADLQDDHICGLMSKNEKLKLSRGRTDVMLVLEKGDSSINMVFNLTKKGIYNFYEGESEGNKYKDEGRLNISSKLPVRDSVTVEYFFKKFGAKSLCENFKASNHEMGKSDKKFGYSFEVELVNQLTSKNGYKQHSLDISKNIENFVSILVYATHCCVEKTIDKNEAGCTLSTAKVYTPVCEQDITDKSRLMHDKSSKEHIADKTEVIRPCMDTIMTGIEVLRIYMYGKGDNSRDEIYDNDLLEGEICDFWYNINARCDEQNVVDYPL